jgi:biopolymer transport protein ExbB
MFSLQFVIKFILLSISLVISTFCFADDPLNNSPGLLTTLYDEIVAERQEQSAASKTREQKFLDDKSKQKSALAALKKNLYAQEHKLKTSKEAVKTSRQTLLQKQAELDERVHSLKDLFSVWKQVTKDSAINAQNSLLSHQFPEHIVSLNALLRLETLPTEQDLKALTNYLKQDIQETGKRLFYPGELIQGDGSRLNKRIERIGPFNAIVNGSNGAQFLIHDQTNNTLSVAPKQPGQKHRAIIEENGQTSVIDPTRGTVLERLSLSPSVEERLHQGGYIGYAIIALGIAGLLLALYRWSVVAKTKRLISQQMKSPGNIDINNPLGRILHAYQDSQTTSNDQGTANTDGLEVRLQEVVLEEMPRLDKGLGALKLIAAVAPLLGLLGTVVGMINTFQTITLVGNADPKLMAGGISQALMTTVLGLVVAVPLLFSHSFVASRVRQIMVFLSQQSLSHIAQSIENKPTSPENAKKAVKL